MSKIKKSDINKIENVLEEAEGFFSASLDFIDEDQVDYVRNLLSDIRESIDILDKVNK